MRKLWLCSTIHYKKLALKKVQNVGLEKISNDWRIFILFANLLPDIFVVKVDFLPFKFKFTESSNSYISLPSSSKVNFMCCFLKRIMNNSSSASRLFGKHYISLDTFLGRPLQKKAESYGSYFLIRSLSWRHNAYISLSLKILWEFFSAAHKVTDEGLRESCSSLCYFLKKKTF